MTLRNMHQIDCRPKTVIFDFFENDLRMTAKMPSIKFISKMILLRLSLFKAFIKKYVIGSTNLSIFMSSVILLKIDP